MHIQIETNSEQNFRELLIASLPRLRAYARALTGSRDQADDLVQETVLRLLAARETYEAGSNFRAWAITALRNRFIDDQRRARFRVRFHAGAIQEMDTSWLGQPPVQDTIVYLEQTAREFWRLPAAHREVLALVGINGMKYEDAAKVLDMPVGTVRSRLARARAALQLALDRPAPAEAPIPAKERRARVQAD